MTAGTLKYALVVEELHETVEIVVKPLGRHLKGSRGYAGATILGDGKVALILDIAGIAEKAGLASISSSPQTQESADEDGPRIRPTRTRSCCSITDRTTARFH